MAHDTLMVVKLVEAQYESGVLRPSELLSLRPGEKVSIIVVRRPDPSRWDLARLGSDVREDAAFAEEGLEDWASGLESEDRA